MKQTILFLLLVTHLAFLNIQKAQAQKLYAGIHSSYHFGTGGSMNGYFNAESSTLSATFTSQKVNFGTGIQLGANVGYLFMKNIGLDLSFDKAFKNNIELNNQYRPAWTGTYSEKLTFSFTSILISPSIIVKTNNETINLYSKFGLLILKGKLHNTYYENNNTHITEHEYDLEKISGLGYKCALGTLIKLSKSINLQMELNTSNINATPKREVMTKNIEDGVDKLPSMTVSERETEFVDKYTITSTPASTSKPSKSTKVYLPYNNVGIQIGVQFKF